MRDKIKAAGQLLCYTAQLIIAANAALVLMFLSFFALFTWVVAIPYAVVAIIYNLVSSLLA